MNKNIKRTMAFAIAVGVLSSVAPNTNFNFLATKAYASNDDAEELDSIDLQDDDGDSIELYKDDDYDDEVDDDLDVGDTYYAEVTTGDAVTIDSVSGSDDDKVRIFVGSDEYEVGDSISIDDDDGDTTTLKVRVYEDDYDEDEDYTSSDYNEYKIIVEYNGDDDDDDDDDNDEDTLDSLELQNEDGDTINLYSDSDYDDEVDSDEVDEGETYYAKTSSDKVSIETSGPDDEYVRVFKSTSDSAESLETGDEISVSGDKTLTVRIYSEEPDDDIEYEDDDDVIGEYTIELEYTGDSSSDTTTENTTSTSSSETSSVTTSTATINVASAIKPSQWVQVNGYWQYNDSLGKPLVNQWFFDRNYGKWYYLGESGIMAGNRWILTGGKYYYVGSDGAMATNTIISGYKVGADGAWIQ